MNKGERPMSFFEKLKARRTVRGLIEALEPMGGDRSPKEAAEALAEMASDKILCEQLKDPKTVELLSKAFIRLCRFSFSHPDKDGKADTSVAQVVVRVLMELVGVEQAEASIDRVRLRPAGPAVGVGRSEAIEAIRMAAIVQLEKLRRQEAHPDENENPRSEDHSRFG